jgi:flavin-dependent dehydrogenase
MFTDFKAEATYLARTVAMFKERVGFSMRNARRFGGYANFRLPRTAVQGGHLVVGEQAGFQNALAGFGMRYCCGSFTPMPPPGAGPAWARRRYAA